MLSSKNASLLQVSNLSKKYKRSTTLANGSINLTFNPGELTALIGHNGAGKTTLLNQIIGITKPTDGDIFYEQHSLVQNPDKARKLTSIMPQLHAPLTGVTPSQAISSIGRIRGLSHKSSFNQTKKLLCELDIEKWKRTPGEKLSGGIQRLTSYAMSVINPPPILLIDEPTNDVDPFRRPLVWNHLRHLANSGHIVVVVTHNLLEIENFADRYIVLQEGKVRYDKEKGEIFKQGNDIILRILPYSQISLDSIPFHINISHKGKEVEIQFKPKDTDQILQWVSQLFLEGKIKSYTFSQSSLENIYERISSE